ncbi:MAG: hypothetical protein H7Y00_01480 [Fimbriimonadaceae bacterium]|nr:hypothetical protein [Chitinophagales bacterium]
MRNFFFSVCFLSSVILSAQINSDSLQIILNDTLQEEFSTSDSVIQFFANDIDGDKLFIDTPAQKNSFIVQAYRFLDSIKYAAEDTVVYFANEIWNDSAHSPGKAALFSVVLPGLGQIYNGKVWKVPIVYASLGTAGFFIWYWGSYYNDLKTAIIIRLDGDSTTIDEFAENPNATTEALLAEVEYAKKYTDLSYVVFSFVYLLNIIDAIVDAHLYNFDVSDDLTMHIDPYAGFSKKYYTQNNYSSFQTGNKIPVFGIKINLSLK